MNFACPRCHTLLQMTSAHELSCPHDGLVFQQTDGIWRFLLPDRASLYTRFILDYETVRRSEKRGAPEDVSLYRRLPYHSTPDWKIRARSFDTFVQHVLEPFEQTKRGLKSALGLQVVDLGAGNGWLSNRLSACGHDVTAIDLTVNNFDGLGCFAYYETSFTPAQAEFDYLPFADNEVDMVIFNASLHYSTNYETTLRESLRVLKPDGKLVILDSPVYHDPSSGEQMVRERQSQFLRQYGFASNSLPSENYLTDKRLSELGQLLNLSWEAHTPFYNLKWALRPLVAKVLGRREPARFQVIVGTVLRH